MAWEARLGLKLDIQNSLSHSFLRLNGLGSPFGIETWPMLLDTQGNIIG